MNNQITLEEKIKIETDFLHKYPNDILTSWDSSHYDIPNIINENNYKIGVEIGVAYGGHCESILKNTNVQKLFGIDPYLNYNEYNGDLNFEQNKHDDIYNLVKNRLSYYGEKFELIRDFSENCFGLFEDGSLDFVYIDGNHFEDYIKKDIEIWWPKIKNGGIISGHDYHHPYFPSVTYEVNNFFKNIGIDVQYLGNHNWCVIKK